ncbi:MAG TPA: hypothetical protein VH583_23200 [Vicinamibacterales bacterium]|jgi:hypothetical protein
MRARILVTLVTVLCCALPAVSFAVTVDEIVALSKAGVSEAVILALLDRDHSILTIEPQQVVSLKKEGLSDTLITAMLRNGRQEGDDAARAVSAEKDASILSDMASQPAFVVVGHGPERPDTVHTEDFYLGFRDGVRLPAAIPEGSPYAVPYAIPYALPYAGAYQRRAYVQRSVAPRNRAMCVAQVNTAKGRGPAYVTQCPAVMQRPAGAAR